MNKILDYLEQLGLSEIEAKLYLTLLKTGPISVRELAETTKIKRTTAYLYIDQLIDKELVMKLVRGSKKLVVANTPQENLQQLVANKLERAKKAEENLPDMLSLITKSLPQTEATNEAEIRYYQGINHVKKIYENAFTANEVYAFARLTETDDTKKVFSNNITAFQHAFSNNPKLSVKEIIYDSPLAKEQAPQLLSKSSRYSYRYMPKEMTLASEDILIYDGKVAIINYKGKVNSVVLQSMDFYNNLRQLFIFIWEILPDTNELR